MKSIPSAPLTPMSSSCTPCLRALAMITGSTVSTYLDVSRGVTHPPRTAIRALTGIGDPPRTRAPNRGRRTTRRLGENTPNGAGERSRIRRSVSASLAPERDGSASDEPDCAVACVPSERVCPCRRKRARARRTRAELPRGGSRLPTVRYRLPVRRVILVG